MLCLGALPARAACLGTANVGVMFGHTAAAGVWEAQSAFAPMFVHRILLPWFRWCMVPVPACSCSRGVMSA